MKQGWEIKQLGDVCEVQRGLTYTGKDAVDFSNTVVLRATNINLESSRLDFDELKYLRDDFKIKDSYKLKKGSLLICFSSGSKSHLGKVALVDKDYDFAFGGFIGQISPNNKILSEYLFYNLVSEKYKTYISELTDGVNINNLKIKDLQAFPIPTPPIDEQKRIVAKLDKCFEAINTARANVEKNLNNAKELFQSQLNQIFSQKGVGWVEKKLGEVCQVIAGQSPKGKYYNSDEKGLPFYQGKKEFTDKYIGAPKTWSTMVTKESFEGDILMSVRAPVGPINFSTQHICIGRGLAAIRAGKTVNREYLFYFLLKHENEIVGNTGAVFNSINKSQIGNIVIPLVSLSEQDKIVKQLDEIINQTQSLESNYQQELDALDELKKSILQKAFNGEL